MITDDQEKARLLDLDVREAVLRLVSFAHDFECSVEMRPIGSEGEGIYGYPHMSAVFKCVTFDVLTLIGHVRAFVETLDKSMPELEFKDNFTWLDGLVEGDFGFGANVNDQDFSLLTCIKPRKVREDGLWTIYLTIPYVFLSQNLIDMIEKEDKL